MYWQAVLANTSSIYTDNALCSASKLQRGTCIHAALFSAWPALLDGVFEDAISVSSSGLQVSLPDSVTQGDIYKIRGGGGINLFFIYKTNL